MERRNLSEGENEGENGEGENGTGPIMGLLARWATGRKNEHH